MPTATPTPSPTPTPNSTINFPAIPVTMTFWFPITVTPISTPMTTANSTHNPTLNPTATPSPSPSPSPSTSSRSPFQSPQPHGFFHPMQAMMQAFLASMAASNTSTNTTPTAPPSPSPSPSQSTASASASTSMNDMMSSVPLPTLLNMFWAMQGMNGQPMDLSAFMQGGGNKPTPATAKHIIEQLPKHIYHTNTKPIPSTSTCSVCQDDFTDGDEWTYLPCHHPYHTTCIQPWLKEKHTCPSCRYPLETDDTEFNQRVVYPEQRTWKHTPHTTSTSTSTCSMSHIHHTSCQLLSGNTSMLTLSCGHPYHLECLDTAQRVLHPSSSQGPQTVVCPMCHAHQSFPVHLSELMRITTPTTTSTSTSTTSTSPSSSTPILPKAESPKEIDIPFDYPMTSEAPTSSPSLPPTSTPSSVPPTSSLHGSATIEDATDTEMTDA